MDPIARFADIVRRHDHEIALDEAALLIAACANPGIDVGRELQRLDRLAESIADGQRPSRQDV
jgi:hypothetical protein